jgi:dienelactone hydrolase
MVAGVVWKGAIGCVLVALAVVPAGCGGSAGAHAVASSGPFGYDEGQPLRFVDRGRINHDYPIAVDDVSYTSGRDRISAFLVRPPGAHGKLPAVIYLHGAQGDRKELVVPATWIAARGAVALTITAPSTSSPEPRGLKGVSFLRWQQQIQRRDVIAVRRAIDLLAQRKDVDRKRIGFVGWSAGSHTGGILAGVEPRLRAIVLMSCGVAPVSVYAALAQPALRAPIRRYLGSIDPVRYVRHASGPSLFVEDGRTDTVVPRAALLTFINATPRGTKVRWYDAGHELNDPAFRDQLDWLAGKLGIDGPRVAGAAIGP